MVVQRNDHDRYGSGADARLASLGLLGNLFVCMLTDASRSFLSYTWATDYPLHPLQQTSSVSGSRTA